MNAPLNGISGLSKLLLIRLGKSAKGQGQKGFAIVLFTAACILGSTFPLPLIFSLSGSTVIAQTQDDRKAEAARLVRQASRQFQAKQFQEAIQSWQAALRICREIGDRKGEALTLISLGFVYGSIEDLPQAAAYFQQGLTIARELNEPELETAALEGLSLSQKLSRTVEADRLFNAGIQQFKIGQSREAVKFLEAALATYQEIGVRDREETAINNLGVAYRNLGQYQRAIDLHEKALIIAREIGNRAGEGNALGGLGNAYFSLGQYQRAIGFHEQALAIAQESNDRDGAGNALNNLGVAYRNLGQYKRAIRFHEQALAIAQEIGDRASERMALSNLGLVYREIGEYQQAIEFGKQALTIARATNDRIGEGIALSNLGNAHFNLGEYQQAIEFYEQALAISKQTGDRAGEGSALGGLGIAYRDLGQYQRAIEFLNQYLTIARETGDRADEGTALGNLGIVYFELEQYKQATSFLEQHLAISRELGDRAGEGGALSNLGNAYSSFGQYQQAIKSYQQALVIARETGARAGEVSALGNLGIVYSGLRQYQQAIEFHEQALTIVRKNGDRTAEGNVLTNLGIAYFGFGQPIKATEQLFAAIEVKESLRTSTLADVDKVSFYDTQVNSYYALQMALITQKEAEKALEVAERGRARAFLELLSDRLSVTGSIAKPSISEIKRIAQEQNATLVNYSMVGSSDLYIWIIQPTGELHFQSVDLMTLDRPLSDLVTSSRDAIGVRNRSEPATIVPELKPEVQQRQQAQQRQKLQQLHQLLIEPIAQYLPTNPDERVIFIPQGELFLVPFSALVDTEGNYLIKKHTILTAPSIQVLDLTRQQRQSIKANRRSPIRGDDLLVVGNPIMPKVWNPAKGIEEQLSSLPGAEEEAVTIAKAFATKPLLWEQASESAVVQRMPQARIIHLSTHGLLEYGNPQDSGARDVPGAIALSPSAKDDGLLTSAEILQMKLKAELVVLSACDTGRGKITGDGVIGLSRSLITAGVPSVIVSLWSVPDSPTTDLMSEFYRQWQQNPDKAKALRQAMLITMQKHPNPRDWAGFTLIGESE